MTRARCAEHHRSDDAVLGAVWIRPIAVFGSCGMRLFDRVMVSNLSNARQHQRSSATEVFEMYFCF